MRRQSKAKAIIDKIMQIIHNQSEREIVGQSEKGTVGYFLSLDNGLFSFALSKSLE